MADRLFVLLVSTYDLGRQPFGLASPAAWLREAGCDVVCADLSRSALDVDMAARAGLIGFFLPMHTATRLVGPVIRHIRDVNPFAHLCAYGLYASPNAAWLQSIGIHTILGAEFEEDLAQLAVQIATGGGSVSVAIASEQTGIARERVVLPRLAFRVPDRSSLPALDAYARLQLPDGSARTVGYTEASRGCKHVCRHCPIVPVYDGRFRVVPVDVVVADVRQQVAAGATHITFGDPDFFNGVGHALRVVDAVAQACPGVSYDVTIKVEHLLRHEASLPRLRDTGCILVTSAVESLDNDVLRRLDKGHTRADVERALDVCRTIGLAMAPTFIPFTPWSSVEDYRSLLDALETLDLTAQVPPVQLTLRLLIPEGSRLLELADLRSQLAPFDPHALVYPWRHRDPRVDALQREAAALVRRMGSRDRETVFDALRALAGRYTGEPVRRLLRSTPRPRTSVPFLNEPWYC